MELGSNVSWVGRSTNASPSFLLHPIAHSTHSLAHPLDVDHDVDDDVENDIQDDVDDDVDDDIHDDVESDVDDDIQDDVDDKVIITELMVSVSVMTRSTDSAPTAKYSPIVPAALKHCTPIQ